MRRLIAASLTLLLTASVFAQTYRWTDANGRTMVTDTPPPAGRSAVQSGNGPVPNDGLTPAARQAAANFPVILYTSETCGDPCKQARDLLQGRGVPFTEKPVKTAQEFDEFKQLTGDAFVPTLKVGRQVLRGLEPNSWQSQLDFAGYPKGKGK